MLMSGKVTPIGKAQPLEKAGIKRVLVITAVAINPVETTFHCLFLPFYNFVDLPLVVMVL